MNCTKCGLPITLQECDPNTTSVQHAICPKPTPTETIPTPITNQELERIAGETADEILHWRHSETRLGVRNKILSAMDRATESLRKELAHLKASEKEGWEELKHCEEELDFGKVETDDDGLFYAQSYRVAILREERDQLRTENTQLKSHNGKMKEALKKCKTCDLAYSVMELVKEALSQTGPTRSKLIQNKNHRSQNGGMIC